MKRLKLKIQAPYVTLVAYFTDYSTFMKFDQAQNHFDLFGLPVSFVLDNVALAKRYHELQKTVHPDKYANASGQEKRLALQQAMLINEAHDTLRDPLTRAIYMLELQGIQANQETAAAHDGEFLMQQMELRERLAEIKEQPDPQSALHGLMLQIKQMVKSHTAQLAMQFAAGTPEQLAAAQASVNKMQFLQKLQHEAEVVEEALEGII